MIYTITFNPAVDLVMHAGEIALGDLNRSSEDYYVAGGKGINASVLFKRLGHENMATGFIGGFSGQFIIDELESESVQTAFIELDAPTRINVKLKGPVETEINASGPNVSTEKFQELLHYLSKNLESGDIVFLAGNAAPGLDESAYTEIAKLCQDKEVKFVLDTNKDLLKACLSFNPFIIKPNEQELSEIVECPIQTEEDLISNAKKLQAAGAQNVLVSLGGDGSMLLTATGDIYRAGVPEGEVVNSVGAGDSMLAGFMSEWIDTDDYADALLKGAASGSATAFSEGIAEAELVDQLSKEIKIKKVGERE